MAAAPTPRITCIPATSAPVVAVIRRGPSAWSHVGRWDLEHGTYEPGAWLYGRIYADRCDLSPDGRWLVYFTLRGATDPGWKAGDTYIAISHLPWLSALAAWSTCGTWTRGVHFVDDRQAWDLGEPDEGDAVACRRSFGMRITPAVSFASERRRGWSERAGSPPRDQRGAWDERVEGLVLRKPCPRAPATDLTARGYYAAFRSTLSDDFDVAYALETDGQATTLHDVQWADWSAEGDLLVATTDGRLQVRRGDPQDPEVGWETDLVRLTPDPQPPPPEASRW